MKDTWQFRDVYGLDPELLSMVPRPVCALLLLFPVTEKVTTCVRSVCLRIYSHGLSQKSLNHRYLNIFIGSVHDVCHKSNLHSFTFLVRDIQATRGRKTEEAATGSVTWCLFHQANHWKCLWNNRINSCCGQQPEALGIWWEKILYTPYHFFRFMCNYFLIQFLN